MARDLKALPKAHLHIHLEGAMRQSTLRERADHYGMQVVSQGDGSFGTFIAMYRAACEVIRHTDDLARLVREVAEDARDAGAVWVEPSEWITRDGARRMGLDGEEAALEAVLDAAQRAQKEVGVGVG